MKTRYEEASNDIQQTVDNMINTFPDKFIHINRQDLKLVTKDASTSSWKARTRIMNGLYRMLTGKKIVVEFSKPDWETATEAQKAIIVYRELLKVGYDDKKKKDYFLRKYDVQDFFEILEKLGLSYEKADEFFGTNKVA